MANKEKVNQMTDSIVLAELGERLAQYRLRQNLTQAELASEAGVSKRTLGRLEAGESTQLTNLIRILRVLGLLDNLDSFVPPSPSSPVELLRMQGKERKRASRKSTPSKENEEDWTWGSEDEGEGEV